MRALLIGMRRRANRPVTRQTGAHNGRGLGSNVTVVVLFALFVVAVVTVPVAWTLSVALELLRRARRLEVRVAGLNDAVSDLTHLLTDER